jgi:DNA invertase Pin-like site-specific DNA recombinase
MTARSSPRRLPHGRAKATLLIAKLDRLARSVAFISNLMESDVEFVVADFPQANRLTLHVLAAVAEHEARLISERTKSALSGAKARGTALGSNAHKDVQAHVEVLKKARQVRSAKSRDRGGGRCSDFGYYDAPGDRPQAQ